MTTPRITFGTMHRSPHYGADLRPYARLVEELGYDGLWFNETILGRGPHLDALAGLAAAAGCTDRLRLGTAILLLPLHNPLLVAKTVASIDTISGGRVTLGIGVGGEWTKSFEALGVPVEERGQRTNEAIEIIKALWSGKAISHHGRFFRFDDVAIQPPPAQRHGPPIWIGGRPAPDGGLSASSQRTALLSDGWMPYMLTPAMYRTGLAAIRDRAAAVGRDPDLISPGILLMMTIGESRDAARRLAIDEHLAIYKQDFSKIIDKYDVFGTPEDCIRGIERYVEAGARDIIFQWRCPLAATRENVTLAAQKILPHFR